MKKIIFLLFAVFALNTFAVERNQILKVYNWADYISPEVLNEFAGWYFDQTGEQIEVMYQTFDINESMLTQIEVGHEDYDVICPSEYIIERMLKQGLLLPINKDFGNTTDYTQLVAPFVHDKFQQMTKDTSINVSDYAVGYMWGTTGILYNKAYLKESDVTSLSCLTNPEYKEKIFVKDAFRDVYSIVVLYAYRDEIENGEVTRDELVANITDERIKRVEEFLISIKDNIAGWEVDFGKEEMTKGKVWMNLSWSGDAQWAITEAAENGVDLGYVVPQEGSNVWFDGWCIPKYAVNTKAAAYFINYLCMPKNAIRNMEEIGYVSVIADTMILNWANNPQEYQPVNLTYFFGDSARLVHANPVFYPDKAVIERCALMHDCGDKTNAMLEMWARVKGDNLNIGLVIFLGLVVITALVLGVYKIVQRKQLRYKQTKKKKVNKHK